MKKQKLLISIIFLISFFNLKAQAPKATNLIGVHKVSTSEMLSITGMDSGVLVFNQDSGMLMVYDGAKWKNASYQKINIIRYLNDTLTLIHGDSIFKVELIKRTPQILNITGASATWNYNLGGNAEITLNQATTALVITNFKAGSYGNIVVKQDATGGRTITLPAGSRVIRGGSGTIPLTSTPNARDLLSFYYDGTVYFWTFGNNFD